MDGRGVPRKNFAPPIWKALWSLGIFLPPPPFLMLPAMITVSAVSGALLVLVLWFVFGLMALLHPFRYPSTLAMLWSATPLTAACMAIANPIYYRRMARQQAWSPGRPSLAYVSASESARGGRRPR